MKKEFLKITKIMLNMQQIKINYNQKAFHRLSNTRLKISRRLSKKILSQDALEREKGYYFNQIKRKSPFAEYF